MRKDQDKVLLFPILLLAAVSQALGAKSAARAFGKLRTFETWARRITGVVFIAAGLYLSAVHLFGWWI